ncbi:Cyclic nucleotide-binding domain-containing protein 2, partial [Clydaea vesicula]
MIDAVPAPKESLKHSKKSSNILPDIKVEMEEEHQNYIRKETNAKTSTFPKLKKNCHFNGNIFSRIAENTPKLAKANLGIQKGYTWLPKTPCSGNHEKSYSYVHKEIKELVANASGFNSNPFYDTVKVLEKTYESSINTLLEISRPKPSAEKITEMLSKSELTTERRERAKQNWKIGIISVIKFMRATKVFHYPEKYNIKNKKIISSTNFSETSMKYLLKCCQTRSDILFNTKVQMFLRKNPEDRTLREMVELERLLTTRLSGFSKFLPTQRLQLCYQLMYISVGAGRSIIKEGHEPKNGIYIILSGQVEITQELNEHTLLRLNVLNKGETFGEIALESFLSKMRTATVSTVTQTELLHVSKEEFRAILVGEDNELSTNFRSELVRNACLFKSKVVETVLQQLISKSDVKVFEQGAVILKQGADNDKLHFIIGGSVSVRKSISLRNVFHTKKRDKYRYENKTVCLEIGKLIAGQSFPEIIIPEWLISDELNLNLDSNLFFEIHHRLQVNGFSYPSYSTVTAESAVRLIQISRVDLFKYYSKENKMIYLLGLQRLRWLGSSLMFIYLSATCQSKKVYLRPYLDAFLYNCSKKFEIAVWTTTNKRNTVTLTNLLVLDIFKPLFVWSEDECDTVGFGKTKETFKDLQRVFEKYPQFNKNNTIVLDDSVYKASLNEDFNSLHLPSFTVCDPCFNPLDDAALLSVLKYFNVMFFKKTKDVTEFISSNRFVEIQSEADESAGYKAPSHALVKHNEPTFVILPMWKLTSNEITLFVGKTDRLRPEYSPELILKYSDDNIDSKVIYIWNDVNFTP